MLIEYLAQITQVSGYTTEKAKLAVTLSNPWRDKIEETGLTAARPLPNWILIQKPTDRRSRSVMMVRRVNLVIAHSSIVGPIDVRIPTSAHLEKE